MSEPVTSAATEIPDHWTVVEDLACEVYVDLALPEFRVADLMQLAPQSVIDTHCPASKSVPFRVNGELLAWCEFELAGSRLAVRLTEFAE